jgi:hypothetical protein
MGYVLRTQDGTIWSAPLTVETLGRELMRFRMVKGLDADAVVEEWDPDYREWRTWSEDRVEALYSRVIYQHEHRAGTASGTCVYCGDPMTARLPL